MVRLVVILFMLLPFVGSVAADAGIAMTGVPTVVQPPKDGPKKKPKAEPKKRKKIVIRHAPVGKRVKVCPRNSVRIVYRGCPFFYIAGLFYKQLTGGQYEVVNPEIGMVVPSLPEYNVSRLRVDGRTVYLCGGVLYEPLNTHSGVQYEVIGFMD